MASQQEKRIMPILFPAIIVVAGIIYYVFDPTIPTQFFPKCPFHWLTGWQCPACGIQRAFHALLHGHFLQALQYNYFFIISIPLLIGVILVEWYNQRHWFDKLERIVNHRITLHIYIILFFVWWIVRNILHI